MAGAGAVGALGAADGVDGVAGPEGAVAGGTVRCSTGARGPLLAQPEAIIATRHKAATRRSRLIVTTRCASLGTEF